MDEKLKSEKHAEKSGFLCLCYILRAIRAGRCRERRYADHIFIQIYFIMHHFVVIFSKKFLCLRRQGGIDLPSQNPADVPARARFSKLFRKMTDLTTVLRDSNETPRNVLKINLYKNLRKVLGIFKFRTYDKVTTNLRKT